MGKSLTDEELLNILKDYNDNVGFPKQRDFKPANGLPSHNTYVKRFGDWNKAKQLAGIENGNIKFRKNKYDPDEIIDSFKRLYRELGKVPTTRDITNAEYMPTLHVINKHFGGIDGLIDACNFETNYKNGKYKPEFLINEIKRFSQEFNRVPTATDFDNLDGYPSRRTFTNHFGKFEDAIRLAGFEPIRGYVEQRVYPATHKDKEFLISQIYRFIEEFGHIPTTRDIDNNEDYPSRNHYRTVFGSWNNALKECDLKLNSVSQYEDDFLESEFHRFVKENGRTPLIEDFNKSGYPSFWCYQQRFGSWRNTIRHYGYEAYDDIYHIDKIKEFLKDLCEQIYKNENRKFITIKDIDSNGDRYTYSTCLKHLKKEKSSVRKYLKSLGFKMLNNSCGLIHTFDDGEQVLSQYEYEFSLYLRKNGFVFNKDYFTEVYYKEFIYGYDGLKRIDYIIKQKNKTIYIEIAGFLRDYKNNYCSNKIIKRGKRSEEYRLNLMEKEKMLKENNLEYYIIFPQDCNEGFFNAILSKEGEMKNG